MYENEHSKLELKKVIESIKLIASDYGTQEKIFPDFVQIPDEIALIFDDIIFSVELLLKEGLLNEEQYRQLILLNSKLDDMSFDKSLWTMESLRVAKEWGIVRALSKNILKLFNENDTKSPNIFWVKFI